jgi:hypothetical protein
MTNNDSRLENYLAEFQPRSIRKLKIPPQASLIWMRRLAAAAVLAISSTASLWLAFRSNGLEPQIALIPSQDFAPPAPPKQLGPMALTRLALSEGREFDLYLLYQSRYVLPDPRGEQSSLRVLTTE